MFSFNRTTNCTRGGISAMIAAIMVAALGGAASTATADALYDNLHITNNNTYTTTAQNYIGGLPSAQNGSHWDVQAADDFTLANTYQITSVTADLVAKDGLAPESVLVEFFSDNGGAPSSSASAAYFTTSFAVTNFNNHLNSDVGMRFTVDLSGAGITLGAGTWWMSIVPVDVTNDERYFWVRQTGQPLIGASAHIRDGGQAHGNGLPGPMNNSDWQAFGSFGPPIPVFQAGDLAMQIQGTLIPAPGALAILGLAGMLGGGRRRKNV